MTKIAAIAVVLLLAACSTGAAGARFRDLPEPERDAMDRCTPSIRRYGACAPQQDRIGVEQDTCMDRLVQRYAMLPDAASRKDLLLDSGCPPETVAEAEPQPEPGIYWGSGTGSFTGSRSEP